MRDAIAAARKHGGKLVVTAYVTITTTDHVEKEKALIEDGFQRGRITIEDGTRTTIMSKGVLTVIVRSNEG
jgi:hypothetical protein